MKDNNWIGREARTSLAEAHTAYMDEKYSHLTEQSIKRTAEYSAGDLDDPEGDIFEVHGHLVATDTVTAIFSFASGKTAALNFASHKNPGGMFIKGSKAQEECLCHESNLYNILRTFENTYYTYNRQHLNRALYIDRALYTPDVLFERNGASIQVDVITCAAPNKTAAQKYQNVTDEENSEVLRKRIKFVLDIAYIEGVETLILGAYGCGVFGQDASEVAQIFKELLPLYPFKQVIFAIPQGNGNFEQFKEVWIDKEKENE